MSKAYVETTILTNVLLKPGTKKQSAAASALSRYTETLLPVYSIKEWKNGPLDHYAYVHDKFVQTKSLADTLDAINALSPYFAPYKRNTSFEALAAAARLSGNSGRADSSMNAELDRELADRFRLALASLIVRSWRKRRQVTTKTVHDLECYTDAQPKIDRDGYVDLRPQKCDRDRECCLAGRLKANTDALRAIRNAIPKSSPREEDRKRRQVLKQLINSPKLPLTEEQCRWLGDAVFAFFCPDDAIVLTTNIKDHRPIAVAIGKNAESP
jgi:hypothetical protein